MIKVKQDTLNNNHHNRHQKSVNEENEDEADDEESVCCDEFKLNNPGQNCGQEFPPECPEFNVKWDDALETKFAHLLDTGAFTDVKFRVGEGSDRVERKAHKIILALSSPVFMKMFYGSLKSESVIEIPDVDANSFDALLQYIYKNGKISIADSDGALGILYAAHKYDIHGLESACEEMLVLSINPSNILNTDVVADMYQLKELKAKCWKFIQDHTETVLNVRLESVSFNKLVKILEDDHLNIDEVDLFEIVVRWAENECKRQGVEPTASNKLRRLSHALHHIRFPTMNSSDFANRVVPTGLLNSDQIAKVLTYICASSDKRKDISLEFSTKARQPLDKSSNSSITSSYKQHQQLLVNNLITCGGNSTTTQDQTSGGSNESSLWTSHPDLNANYYYDWFSQQMSLAAEAESNLLNDEEEDQHPQHVNVNVNMNPYPFPPTTPPGIRAFMMHRQPNVNMRYQQMGAPCATTTATRRADLTRLYLGIQGGSNSSSSDGTSNVPSERLQGQGMVNCQVGPGGVPDGIRLEDNQGRSHPDSQLQRSRRNRKV